MKTLLIPIPYRALLTTVVSAALMVITPPPIPSGNLWLSLPETPSLARGPISPTQPVATLPFTIRNVVVFLSTNLKIAPVESRAEYAMFICTERLDGTGEEIMRITVSARSGHLRVAFTFREMSTMQCVAEFIESPLFTSSESEQLYAMLYSSNGPRWQPLERFLARAAFTDLGETAEAVFEFAPGSFPG